MGELHNTIFGRKKVMPITELLEKNAREYPNDICLVEINPEIKDFYDFTVDDFKLIDYKSTKYAGKIPVAV